MSSFEISLILFSIFWLFIYTSKVLLSTDKDINSEKAKAEEERIALEKAKAEELIIETDINSETPKEVN